MSSEQKETEPATDKPYEGAAKAYLTTLPTNIRHNFLAKENVDKDKLDKYQKFALRRLEKLRADGLFVFPC